MPQRKQASFFHLELSLNQKGVEPPLECLHSFSTSEEDQLASPEKRNDILIIFIKQTSILSIISTPKTLQNQIDHQSLANIIQSRVLLQYAFTPQLGFKRFLGLYSLQNQYKSAIITAFLNSTIQVLPPILFIRNKFQCKLL